MKSKTVDKIIDTITAMQSRHLKVTQFSMAQQLGINRSNLSRRYRHLFSPHNFQELKPVNWSYALFNCNYSANVTIA